MQMFSALHLLQTLTKPNGMTLTQTYEQHRDLLTQMDYKRGNTLVARRSYQYGTLGRPTSRTFSGNGKYTNDPNSTAEPNSGAIPPGKYYVIERQSGGRLGKIKDLFYELRNGNDRTKWLALIAIDDKIDNSTTVNGVIRSNFRMHPGSTSLGCITFMDFSVFEMVRKFILDTESEKVQNAMGGEYIYYGILEVKAE